MGAPRPSMEYLASSSPASLESMELAKLSRAANLRKELQQVLEEWVEAEVDARMARSILDWRRARKSLQAETSPAPKLQQTKRLDGASQPRCLVSDQLAFAFAPAVSPPAGEPSPEGSQAPRTTHADADTRTAAVGAPEPKSGAGRTSNAAEPVGSNTRNPSCEPRRAFAGLLAPPERFHAALTPRHHLRVLPRSKGADPHGAAWHPPSAANLGPPDLEAAFVNCARLA